MTQPSRPDSSSTLPAEPLPDNNTGGIASTADAGLADALQRSSERGDDPATGLASTGNAASGGAAPRSDLGGKNEPGSAPGASGPGGREAGPAQATATSASTVPSATGATRSATPAAGQPSGTTTPASSQRTPAEKPDGPLDSLGKAVSEVVTGSLDDGNPPGRRQ